MTIVSSDFHLKRSKIIFEKFYHNYFKKIYPKINLIGKIECIDSYENPY